MSESGRAKRSATLQTMLAKLPDELVAFGALALSSMANQIVRFFTGILNARLLTPTLYAINSLAGVIVRYVSYGHLGVQNGANRQIPIEVGRGAAEEADEYAGTAFWVVVGVSCLMVVLAVVMWFVPLVGVIPREYYADIALLGVATLLYQYFCSWLVSTARTPLLASMRARYDLPAVILTTVAVLFFRLHGLLLVQSLSMLIQTVVIVRKTGFRPKVFSARRAHVLFVVGWPILASSLLIFVFMTIDLLFVTSRYSTVEVGLYGFALNAAFFYRTYAQSMADVLQPKMGHAFGAGDENPRTLSRFALDYTYGLTPIFAMIAAVFYMGIPVVIELFLPSYGGAIAPFRFLLLAELILSLYIPSGHAMTLMRKQKQLIIWMIAGSAVAAAAFLLVLSPSAPLASVSLLWLIVSVLVSFGIICMATVYTAEHREIPYRKTARNLAMSLGVLAILAGFGGWAFSTSGLPALIEAVARLIVIEIALLVLLVTVDPSNPIASKLRGAFRSLRKAE